MDTDEGTISPIGVTLGQAGMFWSFLLTFYNYSGDKSQFCKEITLWVNKRPLWFGDSIPGRTAFHPPAALNTHRLQHFSIS